MFSPRDSRFEALSRLRRAARRGIAWRGAVVSLLCMLALYLLLGWCDWLLRPTQLLLRMLLTALFWGGSSVAIFRFLLRPLRHRSPLVEIALWLEELHPEWEGEFAARVALDSDRELDRTIQPDRVKETDSTFRNYELPLQAITHRVQRRSRRWRWIALASGTLIVMMLCAATFWNQRVVERVVLLNQDSQWPRRTELTILGPTLEPLPPVSMLTGSRTSSRELIVVDEIGEPPGQILFETITDDGETYSRWIKPTRSCLRNRSESSHFSISLPDHRGESLRIRVRGDDNPLMPWHTIWWGAAPEISSLKINIAPPAYLHLPEQNLESFAGTQPVIAGSTLTLHGQLDRPVASLSARWQDSPQPSLPISVGKSRQFQLTTEVPLIAAGEAELQLIAQPIPPAGLLNTVSQSTKIEKVAGQLRFLVTRDDAPELELKLAETELQLTPQARIMFEAAATDDFGISVMRMSVFDDSQKLLHETHQNFQQLSEPLPKAAHLSLDLDLQKSPVKQGMRLQFVAEAIDGAPDRVPVRSRIIELKIIDPNLKRQQIQTELKRFAASVQKSRQRQQTLAQRLDSYQHFAPLVSRAEAATRMIALQTIAGRQQELSVALVTGPDSLKLQSERLLLELRRNRIDDPQVAQILRMAVPELNELSELTPERFTPAMNQAIRSLQLLEDADETSDSIAFDPSPLRAAQTAQRQVESRLKNLADRLGIRVQIAESLRSWEQFFEELSSLIASTRTYGSSFLSRSPIDLPRHEQAQLKQLAEKHHQLAQWLREQASDQGFDADVALDATDPFAADYERCRRALDAAGQHVQKNQIALALVLDQQTEDLLRALQNRRDRTLVSEPQIKIEQLLDDVQEWLAQTGEKQQKLIDQARRAEQLRDIRSRQNKFRQIQSPQKALAAQSLDFALQLKFTSSNKLGAQLQRIAEQMQQLAGAWQGPEPSDWDIAAQEVRRQLALVEVELSSQRRKLERVVEFQRRQELADELSRMEKQQLKIVENGEHWLQQSHRSGQLSRSEQSQLLQLAQSQRGLQNSLGDLAETIPENSVTGLAIHILMELMQPPCDELQQFRLNRRILDQQRTIAERMGRLAGRLKNADPNQAGSDPVAAAEHEENSPISRLVILLELQQDLVADEQASLNSGSSIDLDNSKRFSVRQRQISRMLEHLQTGD